MLLLFEEHYLAAIPVLLEIIDVEQQSHNDDLVILARVEQLYALYGLAEKYGLEEETLMQLLDINEKLFGKDDEFYWITALALAENYCTQKKYFERF